MDNISYHSSRRILLLLLFNFIICLAFSQNSSNTASTKKSWFKENVSIRKTFDGSKNEKKPATLSLFENHKNRNDFINVDIAVKLIEFEPLKNSGSILTLFPVVEWHKSSNDDAKKDNLSIGLNGEYYFGKDWNVKPYLLSNFVFKRNLMESVNEIKYVAQMSFFSLSKNAPGYPWRFNNKDSDYRGMYYPYIGFEYYEVPNLIIDGQREVFSTYFIRLFLEYWWSPRTLQTIFNGTFRNVFGNDNLVKNDLPIFDVSLNYYPGKQEHVSIGLNYKNGYDPGAKFVQVDVTSLNLNINF
ncbi:hypothetical protein [Flavivirga spongiicola]|uniref:DUF481 domain-containing protein n=1 Tax=Flavivirga spongiicola TaxID=421621 RepID=A0ABU7XRV0_9FLAO|nr:hypothetical protein [Flavivirga sp. MEBiC05379]MDO5978256.1 hypothetical protein [Flavivirga sp. MEBiC05379]